MGIRAWVPDAGDGADGSRTGGTCQALVTSVDETSESLLSDCSVQGDGRSCVRSLYPWTCLLYTSWDDPRLVSIAALRRRGFTPESIQKFVELCGVAKGQSSVDYAMLEYCIREDLKMKRSGMLSLIHI